MPLPPAPARRPPPPPRSSSRAFSPASAARGIAHRDHIRRLATAARRRDRPRQPHRARSAFRPQRAPGAHGDGAARAGRLARRAACRQAQRISPHADGREQFAEATLRIYGPAGANWSGRWTLVVLPSLPAAQRQRLRRELAWQGYGELSSGIFAHPLPRTLGGGRGRHAEFPAGTLVFDADLAAPATDALLIEEGWDLKELAQRYRAFVRRFERVLGALCEPPDPETGFVLRTLLIHEYRRLHCATRCCPSDCCRPIGRELERRSCAAPCMPPCSQPPRSYLSSVGAQLAGALPCADAAVLERFGGIAPASRTSVRAPARASSRQPL